MIKFRAWHKDSELMLDVLAIDFKRKCILADIETRRIYPDLDYWWKETDIPFEEIILEQSTGLFDMNGVEIFEGDIVKYNTDDLGVISTYLGGFIVESYKHDYFEHIGEVVGEMKIIGNIHEHKHLLEER